jgi:hypothetical protein
MMKNIFKMFALLISCCSKIPAGNSIEDNGIHIIKGHGHVRIENEHFKINFVFSYASTPGYIRFAGWLQQHICLYGR